jgi:hypothetical protein
MKRLQPPAPFRAALHQQPAKLNVVFQDPELVGPRRVGHRRVLKMFSFWLSNP